MGEVIQFKRHTSRLDKIIVTTPEGKQDTELTERIDRIRTSIQRINGLMAELRGMSK